MKLLDWFLPIRITNNFSDYRNRRGEDEPRGEREGGDWGRGGRDRFQDRERDLQQRNDRWQQDPSDRQEPRGNQRFSDDRENGRDNRRDNGRDGGGGRDNGRWSENRRGGDSTDWTTPLPRDEHVELDLFGTGNTGINFSKYEDIPVEATGDKTPNHITSVSSSTFLKIIRYTVLELKIWLYNMSIM